MNVVVVSVLVAVIAVTNVSATAHVPTLSMTEARLCRQLPVSGPCKANMKRYYWSLVNNSCETFVYGGCHGNGNNFETEEKCKQKCGLMVSQPVCDPFAATKAPKGCRLYKYQRAPDGCPAQVVDCPSRTKPTIMCEVVYYVNDNDACSESRPFRDIHGCPFTVGECPAVP